MTKIFRSTLFIAATRNLRTAKRCPDKLIRGSLLAGRWTTVAAVGVRRFLSANHNHFPHSVALRTGAIQRIQSRISNFEPRPSNFSFAFP